MANITELTKKFVENTDKVVGGLKYLALEDIMKMSPEQLGVLSSCLELVNTANELIMEQSKLLDGLNSKIDKILEQTKK